MRKFLIIGIFLLTPSVSLAYSSASLSFPKNPFLLSASQMAAAIEATTSSQSPSTAQTSPEGDNSNLIAFTRPAVVRIIYHFQGTTTIPGFAFNPQTKAWQLDPRVTKPLEQPYDIYATASGFIVSPDGYIVTNAHVVSTAEVKQEIAQNIVQDYMFYALLTSTGEAAELLNAMSLSDITAAETQGVTYIESLISFPTSPTIVIVKPSQSIATTTDVSILQAEQTSNSQEILDSVISQGEPASVVYVNNNFQNDEKDFAVLKIADSDLPSIRLGDSDAVKIGEPIYILGFPANADYATLSSNSTFTAGSVDSLKNSTQNTFEYIETDAKISPGSSGSPLFDTTADVLGIITEDSNSTGSGDNFAFALPINLIKPELAQLGIASSTSFDYPTLMDEGLAQLQAQHCKSALEYFNAAANMNPIFGGTSQYVQPYIDECNALIASGKSIDSPLDYIRNWLETRSITLWIISAGSLAGLLILGFVITFLFRRLHKDDELIEELQHEMHPKAAPSIVQSNPQVEKNAAAISSLMPKITPGIPASIQIRSYVVQSRTAGQTDEQIKAALATAGWKSEEIENALH